MGIVVALGDALVVDEFALGGALVMDAPDDAAVRRCWAALPAEVAVVILSVAAAEALGDRVGERPEILTVTMP